MAGGRESRIAAADVLLVCAAGALWGVALALGGAVALAGAATATGLMAIAAALARRERARLTTQLDQASRLMEQVARALAPMATVTEGAARPVPQDLASGVASLRAQANWLDSILDAVDEPVLAVDSGQTVTMANRAAEAMVGGGSAPRMVGTPLDQLLPDERALAVVRDAIAGEASRGQTRLLTADGPRILEIGAEPLKGGGRGPGTPAAVVTLRDVTEQATALQLKTDFVANASHELRTPLASIKTAAETLSDMGDESPAVRARLVSVIASNAERLEELTRDLLDLSSLESAETVGRSERVDVRAVAAQLEELFESPCAQRRVSLRFDLDPRLGWLWTDGRLLRLVLRNLIDNAVKFAYEESTVLVRGTVIVRPGSERDDARFEVIDRGIGIPLAQQQRIFERFFQVDAARSGAARRRGTGLGLAIVKHALRALGGAIHVSSVWQQGTTMTVDLPASVAATPHA
jgi:two-component system phosphate regulon sensor histidine kinase PhoR